MNAQAINVKNILPKVGLDGPYRFVSRATRTAPVTYLLAFSGLTATGGAPRPYAVGGYEVYDGAGGMRSVVTNNLSGKIESNVRQKDAYAVKSDCIGTVEYADGTRYDLFIAPDGSRFVVVQTNAGKIAAGSSRGAPHSW